MHRNDVRTARDQDDPPPTVTALRLELARPDYQRRWAYGGLPVPIDGTPNGAQAALLIGESRDVTIGKNSIGSLIELGESFTS
jgi:hypothetical protein